MTAGVDLTEHGRSGALLDRAWLRDGVRRAPPDGSETAALTREDERFIAGLDGGALVVAPDPEDPTRVWLVAGGQVGVVRLPSGLEVRIHPKIGDLALMQMVEVAERVAAPRWSDVLDQDPGARFPDLLGWTYLAELDSVLRRGLARAYVEQEDDLPAVRGALRIPALARRAFPPARVPCRFDALTFDDPLNRLVLFAARVLGAVARGAALRGHLARRVHEMEVEVSRVEVTPAQAGRVVLGRHQAHYASLHRLARWVVRRGFHRGTAAAGAPGLAFLLRTDRLYQDFVARLCREWAARQGGGLSVRADRRWRGLLRPVGASPDFVLRPDVVFERDGRPVLVVDAKYERSATQADWYQVVAYGAALRCPGLLLTPRVGSADFSCAYRLDVPGDVEGPLFRSADLDVSECRPGEGPLLAALTARLHAALDTPSGAVAAGDLSPFRAPPSSDPRSASA